MTRYNVIMSIKPCPFSNEGCKYWDRRPPAPLRGRQREGCFSDLDHIVPRRLGTTALLKQFVDLPGNKQQLCRSIHDEKTNSGDEPMPDMDTVKETIRAAAEAGAVKLSHAILRLVQESDQATGVVAGDNGL